MSTIVKIGKWWKKQIKKIVDPSKKAEIGYTRRIEKVLTNDRICAMTFDDGPMNLPSSPDKYNGLSLTDIILNTLNDYGAKGTFDVVGNTENNYPDKCGKIGTPQWGGVQYDHYPDYKKDNLGGAVNNDRLIKRMIDEGHQITNHGFNHIIFGKKPFVYGKRKYLGSFSDTCEDLKKLDNLLKEKYNYSITMGRPPHYVDKIHKNISSYDVYESMNYQYLAASFDGAGWLPSKNPNPDIALKEEIDAMVLPMKKRLEENPDFFCGQIIFQKDGYNMAKRTPIAFALKEQLEILKQYGYKVITVNDLMKNSAFLDIDKSSDIYDKCVTLSQNRGIAFSDNTIRPDKEMTWGEMAMLLTEKDTYLQLRKKSFLTNPDADRYICALNYCKEKSVIPQNVKSNDLIKPELLNKEIFNEVPKSNTRHDIIFALKI